MKNGKRPLKRVAMVLLLMLALCAASVFAAFNGERIYSVDSDEYRYISWLSLLDGISMPSSFGPWSGSELISMLDRIDRAGLDETGQCLYDKVYASLYRDAEGNGNVVSFEFGMNMNADMVVHSNPSTFTHPDDYGNWGRLGDYNRPSPLVSFPLSFAAGDNIFAFTDMSIGENRSLLGYTHYLEKGTYGKEVTYDPMTFRNSVYLLSPSQYMDIDLTFPWRAYLSIGGPWWNIAVGRDRLSMGPGMSGNLMIGDHIPFHNNARLSFFSDNLKYSFSVSSFIHPDNFIVKEGDKEYVDLGFNENDPRVLGSNFFMVHRFESRWERLSFALSEAIMYQSDTGADLSIFSPMAIFHNLYMRSNANSLLSLEFEYDFDNLDLYTVLLVDDMNFPGEFADEAEPPSAMGLQVGVKGAWSLGNGILHSSLEAVATAPFLYIRDDGSRTSDNWGINFIVDFPEFNFNPSGDIESYIHNLEFLGYRYGNDALTADFQIGWESMKGYKLDFDMFYMAHGVRDKYTRWTQLPPKDQPNAPSRDSNSGSFLKDADGRDAVSHTLQFSLEGEYPFRQYCLSLLAKTDFLTVFNYGNRSDGGTKFDFQFMLGLRYTY